MDVICRGVFLVGLFCFLLSEGISKLCSNNLGTIFSETFTCPLIISSFAGGMHGLPPSAIFLPPLSISDFFSPLSFLNVGFNQSQPERTAQDMEGGLDADARGRGRIDGRTDALQSRMDFEPLKMWSGLRQSLARRSRLPLKTSFGDRGSHTSEAFFPQKMVAFSHY